jgi:type IV secretion system protein VirB6
MGFFAHFSSWLDLQLATYIGDNTARVSMALEPTIVTLGTVYVMFWGYLQLTGKIEEPFHHGASPDRAVGGGPGDVVTVMALQRRDRGHILQRACRARGGAGRRRLAGDHIGCGLAGGWLHRWRVPGSCPHGRWLGSVRRLPARWYGSSWDWCAATPCSSWHCQKSRWRSCWRSGPLFICLRLFDGSRRFFDAWLLQLANYGFITVLTVLVGTLLLQLLQSYATQTAALGSALLTVDALDMLLAAVIVLLIMRQIMPIAASLTGGGSLSTMGTVSRGIGRLVRMPVQLRSLVQGSSTK